MDQVKFVKDSFWSAMVSLSIPYHFKSFKDCLPQILFGPFLNTFFGDFFVREQTNFQDLQQKW